MRGAHVNSFSYLLCDTWRVICFEGRTQNLTCVCTVQININMERFTWAELSDIHLAYGAPYGNSREAQRIYHECLLRRVCPDYRTFASVDCHLQETGTFAVDRHSTGQGQSLRMPQCDDILQCFETNLPTSTSAVGHTVGTDCRLVWNIVREQDLHLFNQQKVQALLGPNDYLCQDQFVCWFVHRSTEKPDFPAMVLFTDEACFTREGIFSGHNSHVWAKVNLQTLRLHLFTATNSALWSVFGWALLMTF